MSVCVNISAGLSANTAESHYSSSFSPSPNFRTIISPPEKNNVSFYITLMNINFAGFSIFSNTYDPA